MDNSTAEWMVSPPPPHPPHTIHSAVELEWEECMYDNEGGEWTGQSASSEQQMWQQRVGWLSVALHPQKP